MRPLGQYGKTGSHRVFNHQKNVLMSNSQNFHEKENHIYTLIED